LWHIKSPLNNYLQIFIKKLSFYKQASVAFCLSPFDRSFLSITMPHSLCALYEKYQHDESAINELTVHTAAEMCQHLLNQGVQNLHFYTLNRADLALKTCELLGLDKKASKNQ
jgi:hypothetical protein